MCLAVSPSATINKHKHAENTLKYFIIKDPARQTSTYVNRACIRWHQKTCVSLKRERHVSLSKWLVLRWHGLFVFFYRIDPFQKR